MAVFSCRMCGGALDAVGGEGVCKCGYCGVMQSVPSLDDEEKAQLYRRAENYRRENEYDMALSLYERILTDDFEDADLYWSMLLCRYGIEYVEDTASRGRVPTINRTQYTSVFDDPDYKSAVEYAKRSQKQMFEREAQQIESIRAALIEICGREEPFDIFICCKETDSAGRRTPDSLLANDIYKQLVSAGYRVFFPRVTLADKAGADFEPYIFAALNSSRVMIAVGTSAANFGDVWVKNEWGRYLALINKGETKTLIPAVRNMDAYELPEELAHFQALDMSRLGFMQDMLAGIKRLIAPAGASEETLGDAGSILERVYRLLAERDFSAADKLCEHLLDIQPDSAEGYLAKLLAEYSTESADKLPELCADFSVSDSYKKIMRFGSDELKKRVENYRTHSLFNMYANMLESAESEEQCAAAAEGFRSLGGFMNSDEMVQRCAEKTAELRKKREEYVRESVYRVAADIIENSSAVNELTSARDSLTGLGDYKDSAALIEKCSRKIQVLSSENERLQAEVNSQKKIREQYMLDKTRRRKLIIMLTAALAATAVIVPVTVYNTVSWSRYSGAAAALAEGRYEEAIAGFEGLGGYSDAGEMLLRTKYDYALALKQSGSYDRAEEVFKELGDYSDSEAQILSVRYDSAVAARENGDLDKSAAVFTALGDYNDSAVQLMATKYEKALRLRENDEYNKAADIFVELGDYSDSAEQALITKYQYAEQLESNGDYISAASAFKELGSYSDCEKRASDCKYSYAMLLKEQGKSDVAADVLEELGLSEEAYETENSYKYDKAVEDARLEKYSSAIRLFKELGDYRDSRERLADAQYTYAVISKNSGNLNTAIGLFEELGDHLDAPEQLLQTKYEYAAALEESGDFKRAIVLFKELGDYLDSKQRFTEVSFERLRDAWRGDIVFFGSYEQDADTSNGKEPIEWIVLDRKDGKALLISLKCIDSYCYDNSGRDVVIWEDSALRQWLNGSFIDNAFSYSERQYIQYTTLSNTDSREYGFKDAGRDTVDRVFPLSGEEVQKYKSIRGMTGAEQTKYAALNRDDVAGICYWWVRSSKETPAGMATSVSSYSTGISYSKKMAVRPAMWVSIE